MTVRRYTVAELLGETKANLAIQPELHAAIAKEARRMETLSRLEDAAQRTSAGVELHSRPRQVLRLGRQRCADRRAGDDGAGSHRRSS
jgi:hypothetical protein